MGAQATGFVQETSLNSACHYNNCIHLQSWKPHRHTFGQWQVAVTEALLDRLEDCKRTFPTVAVLGGAGISLS